MKQICLIRQFTNVYAKTIHKSATQKETTSKAEEPNLPTHCAAAATSDSTQQTGRAPMDPFPHSSLVTSKWTRATC